MNAFIDLVLEALMKMIEFCSTDWSIRRYLAAVFLMLSVVGWLVLTWSLVVNHLEVLAILVSAIPLIVCTVIGILLIRGPRL